MDALILEASNTGCKVLTASEDTTVRLLSDENKELSTIWCAEGHTSSVRSLCECNRLLFSAGGAAELVVWQLQQDLELPALQMASMCLGDTEEEVCIARCCVVLHAVWHSIESASALLVTSIQHLATYFVSIYCSDASLVDE